MIVRKWRGWADADRADGYLQHFAAHVQAKLNRTEHCDLEPQMNRD
jgi:hypothetical protein